MAEVSDPLRSDFNLVRDKINAHIVSGEPFAKPRRIAQALDAVRDNAWESDWLEVFILFNCYGRRIPARTHAALSKLRERLEATGEMVRFEKIVTQVKGLLHPEFITPHGYNVTFSEMDTSSVMSALGSAFEPLAALECPVFLYAGALLGYIRSGELIEHDDDIDIGVYLGDMSDEEVPEAWLTYKRKLADAGLLAQGEDEANKISYKITTTLPCDVDVFAAWTNNDGFSVYPYSLNELKRSSVFPLKSFGQDPLMLPADTEALLAQSYGETWRVPDPFFHLDWSKKKRMFRLLAAQDYTL
jgi:hypothetical protein